MEQTCHAIRIQLIEDYYHMTTMNEPGLGMNQESLGY